MDTFVLLNNLSTIMWSVMVFGLAVGFRTRKQSSAIEWKGLVQLAALLGVMYLVIYFVVKLVFAIFGG